MCVPFLACLCTFVTFSTLFSHFFGHFFGVFFFSFLLLQHDVSEEARASAKLSPSERRQKERLAFRAARRQRLRGGGGAWARDGTFLRHKTTAAEGDGSSSCSRSSSAATSSPLSSSSSAPPSEHNTSKGSGTGASRHQQHQHPGEGRPGALGPCRNLAEASWPMPGCARAKPYYKLSESKIAYGNCPCYA